MILTFQTNEYIQQMFPDIDFQLADDNGIMLDVAFVINFPSHTDFWRIPENDAPSVVRDFVNPIQPRRQYRIDEFAHNTNFCGDQFRSAPAIPSGHYNIYCIKKDDIH
ncbi:hypothetical protein MBANPS3_012320 [Mucor bainieri]